MNKNEIYLSSRSPRRLELLQQMGIVCRVFHLRENSARTRDVDEAPNAGESPYLYVERMAKIKAEIGWLRLSQRSMPQMPLLAADTVVVSDGKLFGKPGSPEEAVSILQALSGTHHEVITAVALSNGQRLLNEKCVTRVRFRDLSDEEIRAYVATGEPFDKAGAYAIQGMAAMFIERIEGSYSGVMGLPIFETARLLSKMGISALSR